MSDARLNVRYGIFCDDVRREDNGKFILIGVYTQQIVVPKFPVSMMLSIFIHGRHAGPAKIPLRVRMLYMPGDLELFSMGGTAVVEQATDHDSAFDFSFGGIAFQAQREGYISLEVSQNQGAWAEIERIGIRAEAPSATSF